jgi:PIN domain nuclease of toxin-antitoxin system
MSVLLDTNALVWASDERKKRTLGKQARHIIENSDLVYFSPISLAEIEIKSATGRLKTTLSIEKAVADGFLLMDFKAEHAKAIGGFQSLTRHDPFDRMLLAQAQVENLLFLTADTILLSLGLPYVVDARE